MSKSTNRCAQHQGHSCCLIQTARDIGSKHVVTKVLADIMLIVETGAKPTGYSSDNLTPPLKNSRYCFRAEFSVSLSLGCASAGKHHFRWVYETFQGYCNVQSYCSLTAFNVQYPTKNLASKAGKLMWSLPRSGCSSCLSQGLGKVACEKNTTKGWMYWTHWFSFARVIEKQYLQLLLLALARYGIRQCGRHITYIYICIHFATTLWPKHCCPASCCKHCCPSGPLP